MKRLLLLLALGTLVFAFPKASMASVSNMSAEMGVYDSTDRAFGLEVDVNNDFTFAPTAASIKWPGTTASTNQTLSATQSGQVIVFNNGAGAAVDGTRFTLPAAVVGLEFTIIADVAKFFRVAPASGETINFTSTAAGKRIASSSAAIGDSITLVCFTTGTWSIKAKSGTFAMENNN